MADSNNSKNAIEVGPVRFDAPQNGAILQNIGAECVFRVGAYLGEAERGHGSSFVLNHKKTKTGLQLWCLTNLHVVRAVFSLYHGFRESLQEGMPDREVAEMPAGLRVFVGDGTIPIESVIVPKGEFFKPAHEDHLDFAIFSFTVPTNRQTRYFPMAQRTDIVAGSKAYVLGYPADMNMSISDGVLSRIYEDGDGDAERTAGADITFFKWGIQHNILTNGGNSGGPTVDEFGRVVGIHTYKLSTFVGLNFSLNVAIISDYISDPTNLEEIAIPATVEKLRQRAIESGRYG